MELFELREPLTVLQANFYVNRTLQQNVLKYHKTVVALPKRH